MFAKMHCTRAAGNVNVHDYPGIEYYSDPLPRVGNRSEEEEKII